MILDTLRYIAPTRGPRVLVLAGVHGDETAGTEAILRFARALDSGRTKLLRGSVTLVPVANPSARATMTRQTDANLNRIIFDHPPAGYAETAYARDIAELIREHDILLDLHSFSAEGSPFVFLDSDTPDERDLALSLGSGHIVTGWPALYPDDDGGDTCAYARACGRIGITVECGQHMDTLAPAVWLRAIEGLLSHADMLPALDTHIASPTVLSLTDKVLCPSQEARFARPWRNLEPVSAWEAIGYVEDTTYSAPADGYVFLPNPWPGIGNEWYYFAVDKSRVGF